MKNRIFIVALLSTFTFGYKITFAQDAAFTQYYAVPLLLNPAIMGASNDAHFGLDYRNQWASVNSGYNNYAFNGSYPIPLAGNGGKLDAGLSLVGGRAGAFSTFNGLAAVDYNKEIAQDNYLCLALIGGYGQQAISTSGLTFDDQFTQGAYNPNLPNGENLLNQKAGYADVGFGFTWYYNPLRTNSKINAFVGVSGYHLNQPNISLSGSTSKLPALMSYQAGLKLFEASNIDITPSVRLNVQSGNTESAIGLYGDYLVKDELKLSLGCWYRRNDAFALLVGFSYKNFILGYSYDAVTSTISSMVGGVSANEITLQYNLVRKNSGKPSFGGSGSSSSSSSDTPNPSPFPSF